jgi:hypothetical protein
MIQESDQVIKIGRVNFPVPETPAPGTSAAVHSNQKSLEIAFKARCTKREKLQSVFLSSGLYRRYRNLTDSANTGSRTRSLRSLPPVRTRTSP